MANKKTVAIEIGHWYDPTERGHINGVHELATNIIVGLEIKRQIERHGFKTLLNGTKQDGVALENGETPGIGKSLATFYSELSGMNSEELVAGIAVHFNATITDSPGFEAYTQTTQINGGDDMRQDSEQLCKKIADEMREIRGDDMMRIPAVRNPFEYGVESNVYHINNLSAPFAYCEFGFMDNPPDRSGFDTIEKQQEFGKAAAKGILNYLNVDWIPEVYGGVSDYLIGDVNADGVVTMLDALEILKHITGQSSAVGVATPLTVADVDGDGEITIFDALEIIKNVAGLPSKIDPPVINPPGNAIKIGDYVFDRYEFGTVFEDYQLGPSSYNTPFVFVPFFIYKNNIYFEAASLTYIGHHVAQHNLYVNHPHAIWVPAVVTMGGGHANFRVLANSNSFNTTAYVEAFSGADRYEYYSRSDLPWVNGTFVARQKNFNTTTIEQITADDTPEFISENLYNFSPNEKGTGVFIVPPTFFEQAGMTFFEYIKTLTPDNLYTLL
ncbi:MAG: N-acetylmuramoyl-L-alanine amidase [Oscillospiraceae bacterium]|nr:N-acetylmuramoyl-L-alanine amidase [Oscillospiraceae bacterium]